MILHIFPKTQFTEDYVLFIRNHFNEKDHRFILYTNKPFDLNESLYKLNNVYDYDEYDIKWLREQLKQAKGIIFHNLGIPAKELFLIGMNKRMIRKSVWMIWGADLYCHMDPRKTIGDHIVEGLRRRIARNIARSVTLTDGDYSLLCEWYNCSPKNYRLEYMSERSVEQMKKLGSERNGSGPVRIMVGNSAARTNCHIEAFDILRRFKDENIQIISPLSYGDMEYADEVERTGKKLFGAAFVAMREYIPKNKYYDFLHSIDIGIFNNNRQQGMGNIQALMFYKRRVFIRNGTTMWTEWNDKEGYTLEDINDIREMSFERFVNPDKDKIENNYNKVYSYYDAEARARDWAVLFDELEA